MMGRRMMRLTLLAAAAVVAVAIGASSAVADGAVIHAEATLTDLTFHDAYLSHACGFDVNDTLNAHTTATGYLNKDGRLATEVDTWRDSGGTPLPRRISRSCGR